MLTPVPELLADLQQGKMVILMDDEDRENEGDLVFAAEFVTPEAINFLLNHARGQICLPMSVEFCQRMDLHPMVPNNNAKHGTPFTVSVDAAAGGTGVSVADRVLTIKTAIDENAKPEDLLRPGHTFPLMSSPNGVFDRLGHTDAVVDLMKLAGLKPAGVLAEILNEDGTMARYPDLKIYAAKHNLKIGTVADVFAYRKALLREDAVA